MKTAMQEFFTKLEIEHPNLFNTNTQEGRKFINEGWEFLKLEANQLKECYKFAQAEQRKEFSSNYIGIKFDEWFKNYKNE